MYQKLLGAPAWNALAPPLRALHAPGRAHGQLRVRRGRGLAARILGWLCRFPAAIAASPLALQVTEDGAGLCWERTFGGVCVRTRQTLEGQLLGERFGPIVCLFELRAHEGRLEFLQRAAWLAIGPFRARLPRFLAPRVSGIASAAETGVAIQVEIHAPLVGLVLAYDGLVKPVVEAA